ncbi:MAG: TIR domain-containing protein [Hyphomonadaceae bacterium]
MPDIFLSYNREDQARARLFADAFEAQGFDVWWDTALKSGEAYDEVTETALRTAKAVVVLWSPRSVVSRWVRAEATLADRNRTLVPCMIEPCERPIMFELVQTAELSHWRGEADDRAWLAFLADVTRFVNAERAAAPLSAAVPPPRPVAMGAAPALAVLPFANRSGLAEDEAFAVGMVEDIVAALTSSADLKVLAAGATARWRGKAIDLRAVGRELDVRYLLEGNLRRVGETLRVTAQLVEAETGAVLWMQKFDRPLAELAALQEDLVTEVTAHLHIKVWNLESARVLKGGAQTVHELVLRADALLGESHVSAIAEARRAIAIAPDHARAHAVLASALAFLHLEEGGIDPSRRLEMLAEVGNALALDQKDPSVAWRCASALVIAGRPDDARRHVDRLLPLTPNNPMLYFVQTLINVQQGLGEQAIASVDAWDRLAPGTRLLSDSLHLRAVANYQCGRMDAANDVIDHAYSHNPHHTRMLATRAALKQMTGATEAATEAIEALRAVEPGALRERFTGQTLLMLDPRSSAALNAAFIQAWDAAPVTA